MSGELGMSASQRDSGQQGDQGKAWSFVGVETFSGRSAGSSSRPTLAGSSPRAPYLDWGLVGHIIRVAAETDFRPSPAHIRWRRRIKLYFNCAAKWRVLQAWHKRNGSRHNGDILKRHPLFPIMTRRPYINTAWTLSKSQAVIEGHYEFVQDRVPWLGFPLDGEREIAVVPVDLPGLTLILDKAAWFQNEGELVLNLFLGRERVHSLAFSLGYKDGDAVAYIGALQGGRHGSEALERNRQITRTAFGMRSRDLTFAAFRMLCLEIGIARIVAPGNSNSVVDSQYFSDASTRVHADYDAAWFEYGGTLSEGGTMYEIPVPLRFRNPDDIPSKKKGMYRRRYEMLRMLQSNMATNIAQPYAQTTEAR